jgi:DNA helicase HerA-like ATPase
VKVDIDMGTTATHDAAKLDIEELLATRLLVQGNSGSGKSHLLRRLLEQSAKWVQQVVIDPEGDFVTLADAFGHIVVDADRSEGELIGIANRIRQHRVSCVLTLEGLEIDDQMRAAATFLNALFDADREFWFPVLTVVDEAQMFAPAAGGEVAEDARRASLGAMTNLMCRGRKRGLAGVIATQRLAKLAKNVAAEASNFLMGRTFLDIDMARAADLLGMDRRQAEQFRDLQRGSFVALGPALSRRPLQRDHRPGRDRRAVVQPEADAAARQAGRRRGPDLHAGPGGFRAAPGPETGDARAARDHRHHGRPRPGRLADRRTNRKPPTRKRPAAARR